MDDPRTYPEPPEDPAQEAQLDAAAEADIAAGRVVPHAKVVEWVNSWGTANPLPRPKPASR